MKNILTAAMMAFLFLFVGVGCDDEKCTDTASTAQSVDVADAVANDQGLGSDSDASEATDAVEPSGDSTQTDSSVDVGEALPADATETSSDDAGQ